MKWFKKKEPPVEEVDYEPKTNRDVIEWLEASGADINEIIEHMNRKVIACSMVWENEESDHLISIDEFKAYRDEKLEKEEGE